MKTLENIFFGLAVIFGLFIIGPEVASPDLRKPLPEIPYSLSELKTWIDANEATFDNIKPDNASKLEYYDSIPQKN